MMRVCFHSICVWQHRRILAHCRRRPVYSDHLSSLVCYVSRRLAWQACLHCLVQFPTCPDLEVVPRYSTARVRTLMTRQTPWPRVGRCPRPCLGRAFQSIKSQLPYDMWHAVSRILGHGFFGFPPPPRTGRHAKSGSQRFHREFQFVLAVWRKLRTGTFLASKGEQRISGDILQWTDRYSIPSGRSLAPSAPLNLPLAISTVTNSTRSSL